MYIYFIHLNSFYVYRRLRCFTNYLFIVIIAIDRSETPKFPYLINGNIVQRKSP